MSLPASLLDVRHFSRIVLVAGVYFLLAKVALVPPFIDGDLGKIVWPASGFALGALLLYGIDLWPGVALAAFLVTQLTSGPLIYSLATAAGNSLEVLSAALLLRQIAGLDRRMDRARDVVALLLCGGLAGAFASATFGALGLYLSDAEALSTIRQIWWKWALGHAMGMIVVTPFMLTVSFWWRTRLRFSACIEAAALFLLLFLVGAIAFWGGGGLWSEYDLEYLPFPLLVWAAFRFGVPGAAAANLVTSGMAVWGTAAGWAPFASGSSSEDLLLTWSFVNVSAVTT
ncbi:MAG: MASE1 domain-containing protein, partial [Vicinamibacteria bacterium]